MQTGKPKQLNGCKNDKRSTYLFIGFVGCVVSLLTILILLNCFSSIAIWPVLFCVVPTAMAAAAAAAAAALLVVPLFTLAALCDGIKLIFTMSLALREKNKTRNSTYRIAFYRQTESKIKCCQFHYMIVTSASGVFNGRPLRNARDITIFDAFASLMVPWKMPKSSTHLIETAFPIQFSLILNCFCYLLGRVVVVVVVISICFNKLSICGWSILRLTQFFNRYIQLYAPIFEFLTIYQLHTHSHTQLQ